MPVTELPSIYVLSGSGEVLLLLNSPSLDEIIQKCDPEKLQSVVQQNQHQSTQPQTQQQQDQQPQNQQTVQQSETDMDAQQSYENLQVQPEELVRQLEEQKRRE